MDKHMVSTTFDLPGYVVVRNLGVVRGIVVRSRSIVGSFGAFLQMIFGGDITLFTELCEQAREDAFAKMIAHAKEMGANGIIGMRYDATEIAQGASEVLAYGSAVMVEPDGAHKTATEADRIVERMRKKASENELT